ncbi:conserved hypothetical protein [Rhodococcus phage E3]|uniref:minor tail protein n=1 Tax=Rhodococcus phage E3 TaxID=1007869 RepID=UPI0002C6A341|nr:minor tail protein [Rhodococcus phage E3]AEQ21034.1 conserved hypothetical protein [Rhodococcus phage E3]
MTSYSNSASQTSNHVPAQILSVNVDLMIVEVGTRGNSKLNVALGYQSGNTLIIPTVGEQWLIERAQNEWRLVSRLPYQDEKMNAPLYPGSTYIGSRGPTFIHGEGLVVPSAALVLGDIAGDDAVTVTADEQGNLATYGRGHSGRVGPKSATVPHSASLVHTGAGVRTIGLGSGVNLDGVPVGAMHATTLVYIFGTPDIASSGTATVVRLLRNGQIVPGSELTFPVSLQLPTLAARTTTLDVTFAGTDLLQIEMPSGPGNLSGQRLSAMLVGTKAVALAW